MKVEIWSDLICPFCYIGKRKLEKALEQFAYKDQIEIVWKSYQLAPQKITDPTKNGDDDTAAYTGGSLSEARAVNRKIEQMGRDNGLNYDYSNAIPANTFNAHRLVHFAKAKGKQSEAEERLLRAYFIEGKNIDDYPTLIALAKEIGLNGDEAKTVLESETYGDAVHTDMAEAKQVGVRGVPFFVFDRKQAISGAQDAKVFLQVFEQSFAAWQKENPAAAATSALEGE